MTEGMFALLIPITSILMVLGIVVAGIWGQTQARRLRAEQRMAMLARGLPIADIERLMGSGEGSGARKHPLRVLMQARSTGIAVSSVGVGLGLFGAVLAAIVRSRGCLVVSATGLIPLAIGVGFLIDYGVRRRELTHFGLGEEAELP